MKHLPMGLSATSVAPVTPPASCSNPTDWQLNRVWRPCLGCLAVVAELVVGSQALLVGVRRAVLPGG